MAGLFQDPGLRGGVPAPRRPGELVTAALTSPSRVASPARGRVAAATYGGLIASLTPVSWNSPDVMAGAIDPWRAAR